MSKVNVKRIIPMYTIVTENFKKPTCANIKKVRAAIVNPLIIFIIKVGSIKMVLVFAGKVMKTAGHVQK